MTALSDNSKILVLRDVIKLAESRPSTGGPPADAVAEVLLAYYRNVPDADLENRRPEDLYGALVSHYQWAKSRPRGTAKIRVINPTVAVDGWSSGGHSVVEIVTDDMAFLVDTATMTLNDLKRTVHGVIHPIFSVSRNPAGELIDAHPETSDKSSHESWMHIEIDRVSSAADVESIVNRLTQALGDVFVAVDDWAKMRAKALAIVDELGVAAPPDETPSTASAPSPDPAEVAEASEFLGWLADDHFAFLGYREYALDERGGELGLRPVEATGLGILRAGHGQQRPFTPLPTAVRQRAKEPKVLVLAKANSKATVHRNSYLDYVGVKRFDEAGEVIGERRFLGLYTAQAYTESVLRIPLLRNKVLAVVDALALDDASHDGKNLINVLENYPRDELFHTPTDELIDIVDQILVGRERRQVRLFTRMDTYQRYLTCLVYLPRDRYNTSVRENIVQILKDAYAAESVDFSVLLNESDFAQVHFVVRPPHGQSLPAPLYRVEPRLEAAARSWRDEFAEAISREYGEDRAAVLAERYLDAFGESYRDANEARLAAVDVGRLEDLAQRGKPTAITMTAGDTETEPRLRVYQVGQPLLLSEVMPRLTSMGVAVVDEHPYRLRNQAEETHIYEFGLRSPVPIPESRRTDFTDALEAIWEGRNEADGFNRLVLAAGLSWRQAAVLRAYAGYLKQANTPFSTETIEQALASNTEITALLVDLFERRFDPDRASGRKSACAELADALLTALNHVVSLDHDRILRSYLALIKATLRTNYFMRLADGEILPTLAFKLDPTKAPDLPQPRPKFEIYVYSPRVEGVHLRFGAVARGGLRWSDRRDDFRTEILGLVKAQMVKNTVIVPVGAKGGFYCKQLASVENPKDEGVACYRLFIGSLLDLTDNLVNGEVVPPPRVVRHDGDDPYLVVAADKGTATFSDIANGLAQDYNFWLGDAFASGGSVGYDHKAMGITAKGAWISVRRHFRERGIDCQTEDFTAVGIGDMSGDVFGNGMLLSRHIRLVAAFDHRDIFIDPNPDAEVSYAERERLFELPGSSWASYDAKLISTGGGVFPRSAKSVPISAEMREALKLSGNVQELTPAELIHAILQAPVDLLWNGGIGTYVKAETETHAEVGDKANDAIRINGSQLRARCVGEGGNLGLTQLGRIEYAKAGGAVCTDFIDNSAGVDTSDHEVNIKILLDREVAAGDLTQKQRNQLLAKMTDEVESLVLADNYEQNLALANEAREAKSLLHVHEEWIRKLERDGVIDRALEGLPTPREMRNRIEAGGYLTGPEHAVVMAWTKIVMAEALLASDLPDDEFLTQDLVEYFPKALHKKHRTEIEGHPLRREIVVTQVVNDLVNGAGITYWARLAGETGAALPALTKANFVAREIFGSLALRQEIASLDNQVDAAVQTDMRITARTLVERASRWLVNNPRPGTSQEVSDFFGQRCREVMAVLPELLVGQEKKAYLERLKKFTKAGVAEDLAQKVACCGPSYNLLGVVLVAESTGVAPVETARVHFGLGEKLGIPAFVGAIAALSREDKWSTMARATLRDDLYGVQMALTQSVIDYALTQSPQPGPGPHDASDWVSAWVTRGGEPLAQAIAQLADVVADDDAELARLSVGLRVVRSMLA